MGVPGRTLWDNSARCVEALEDWIKLGNYNTAKRHLIECGRKLLDPQIYNKFEQRINLAQDTYSGLSPVKKIKFNVSNFFRELFSLWS